MGQSSSLVRAFLVGAVVKDCQIPDKEVEYETIFSDKADIQELFLRYFPESSKKRFETNKQLAELFGIVETQVKTFPVSNGTWMIIDKHTKHLLAKDLKESEVEPLCRKMNYKR